MFQKYMFIIIILDLHYIIRRTLFTFTLGVSSIDLNRDLFDRLIEFSIIDQNFVQTIYRRLIVDFFIQVFATLKNFLQFKLFL